MLKVTPEWPVSHCIEQHVLNKNKNNNFIDTLQKYIRISSLVLLFSENKIKIESLIVHIT